MRKTISLLLTLALTVSTVACGTANSPNNGEKEPLTPPETLVTDTPTPTVQPTTPVPVHSALDMLNAAWNLISDKEKEDYYLNVFGGYMENLVEGAPAKFEISQATLDANNEELKKSYEAAGMLDMFVPTTVESITQQYLAVTPEIFDKIDDSAAVFDFIDVNRLTFAAHHVKNASDVQTVAEALKDSYIHMPYYCNQPERLVVAYKDNYVFTILGISDYAGLANDKLLSAYSDATVIYDDVPSDFSWWDDGLM